MESTQLIDPDLRSSFLGCYDEEGWDNESYIEIALEPAPTNYDDEYRESSDNELQLRISFSSTVPFAGPSSGESIGEEISFSDEKPCKVQKATKKSRVQFPAVNRFLNTIISGSRPEIGESRKGSNISKRIEGGGMIIMKFMMKLRSKNIGALMESFLRPQHQVVSSPKSGHGSKNQRRKSGKNVLFGNSAGVFEINLGGIKRVVESMNWPSIGFGQGDFSSGSSKTASPVHHSPREREMMRSRAYEGAGECSIQAAIAHCKSSYGEPSDF